MSQIRVDLSPPEALACFREVAEAVLQVCGLASDELVPFLERKGAVSGLHRLDVEKVIGEVIALPNVREALGAAARREQDCRDQAESARREAVEQREIADAARLEILNFREAERHLTAALRRWESGEVMRLGVTLANPHYEQDLVLLDGVWDLTRVVREETVIITIGSNPFCELLDRPVAELLRDEIDRRGAPVARRRAIVITDLCWHREGELQGNPVIALGAPGVNTVTDHVCARGVQTERAGLSQVQVAARPCAAALWGDYAYQTRASVEAFIREPDGLTRFLEFSWSPATTVQCDDSDAHTPWIPPRPLVDLSPPVEF